MLKVLELNASKHVRMCFSAASVTLSCKVVILAVLQLYCDVAQPHSLLPSNIIGWCDKSDISS